MSVSLIIFHDDFMNIVQEAVREVRYSVNFLSYTLNIFLTTNQLASEKRS